MQIVGFPTRRLNLFSDAQMQILFHCQMSRIRVQVFPLGLNLFKGLDNITITTDITVLCECRFYQDSIELWSNMSGESLTPQEVGHIYVYSLFIGSFYIICLFRVFIGNLSTFLFNLTDHKCMRWLP